MIQRYINTHINRQNTGIILVSDFGSYPTKKWSPAVKRQRRWLSRAIVVRGVFILYQYCLPHQNCLKQRVPLTLAGPWQHPLPCPRGFDWECLLPHCSLPMSQAVCDCSLQTWDDSRNLPRKVRLVYFWK